MPKSQFCVITLVNNVILMEQKRRTSTVSGASGQCTVRKKASVWTHFGYNNSTIRFAYKGEVFNEYFVTLMIAEQSTELHVTVCLSDIKTS